MSCDEELRDDCNEERDNSVIAKRRDNVGNVEDSVEKIDLASPKTPKRSIERSASTPSRIIGGATVSNSKNVPSNEVGKEFLDNLVDVKFLKKETKALEQKKEYLREKASARSSLSTVSNKSSSLLYMVGGMPVYPADYVDTKFQDIGSMAKGGFGSAYRATHRLEFNEYALKRIDLDQALVKDDKPSDELKKAMQEVMNLKNFKHESIVGYNDCWLQPHGPRLCTLHPHGTMRHVTSAIYLVTRAHDVAAIIKAAST